MYIDPLIMRILIMLAGIVIFGYGAFKETKELDGVPNATIYRFSFFMMCLRGWSLLWFTMIGLFPID